MKKVFILCVLSCLCLLFPGCSNKENSDPNDLGDVNIIEPDINSDSTEEKVTCSFLLFTGDGEVTDSTSAAERKAMITDVTPVKWVVSDGIIEFTENPIMSVKGDNGSEIIRSWNGEKSFYISYPEQVNDLYDDSVEQILYDYSFSSNKYITDQCDIEVFRGEKKLLISYDDKITEYSFANDTIFFEDSKIPADDLYFLCAEVCKNEIRMPFVHWANSVGVSFFTVLIYDIENQTFNWSTTVEIPHEYSRGVWLSLASSVMNGGKMYFSTWDGIF